MNTVLQLCHTELLRRYSKLRKKPITEFGNDLESSEDMPIWRWISDNLTIVDLSVQNSPSGSVVFDPEIGTCIYFIYFKNDEYFDQQVIHALSLRSHLIHSSLKKSEINDELGSWRVVIVWLVDEKNWGCWRKRIAKIRSDSAHLEEIPMEAIVNNGGDWKETLSNYPFSRFLFNMREVLRHSHKETLEWLTADTDVMKNLQNLEGSFDIEEQNEIINEIIIFANEHIESGETKDAKLPGSPEEITKICIENFRNIQRLEIDMGTDFGKVNTTIVHGPNGSGKSNICEAISLGMFNFSTRYISFLLDSDVSGKDRDRYVEEYLRPLKSIKVKPNILINSKNNYLENLVSIDGVYDTKYFMNGTLLSQETSQKFLMMKGDELARIIIGDYSALARDVSDFIEKSYNNANENRQKLLRDMGLVPTITKISTAKERSALTHLKNDVPDIPTSILMCLKRNLVANIEPTNKYLEEWNHRQEKLRKCASELASESDDENIRKAISKLYDTYNRLLHDTLSWFKMVKSSLSSDTAIIVEDIKILGKWLSTIIKEKSSTINQKDEQQLLIQQQDLEKMQQKTRSQGILYKSRLSHFDNIRLFLEGWSKEFFNVCPTCGADLEHDGGIIKVVNQLESETQQLREEFRTKYKRTDLEMRGIANKLAALGKIQCPISNEKIDAILESFRWLFSGKNELFSFLRETENLNELNDFLQTIKELTFSSAPIADDELDSYLNRSTEKLTEKFRIIKKVFNKPDDWHAVRKKVDQSLADTIQKHLPRTIGSLWLEIARNLTSAWWQLPDETIIETRSLRHKYEAKIKIENADSSLLARYIFNSSEIHILGLAWFFSRYFCYGRHKHSAIIMDDPALEMDQTTFRDLCRFTETLVRLHRRYEIPLAMIILLKRESYALELARATRGLLKMLALNKGKAEWIKEIVLMPKTSSPYPNIAINMES